MMSWLKNLRLQKSDFDWFDEDFPGDGVGAKVGMYIGKKPMAGIPIRHC